MVHNYIYIGHLHGKLFLPEGELGRVRTVPPHQVRRTVGGFKQDSWAIHFQQLRLFDFQGTSHPSTEARPHPLVGKVPWADLSASDVLQYLSDTLNIDHLVIEKFVTTPPSYRLKL